MARWVKANRIDGSIIYVNMDKVWIILPQQVNNKDVTCLLTERIKKDLEGNDIAIHEFVKQTPEELLGDGISD